LPGQVEKAAALALLLRGRAPARIVVVGDLILDEYVDGETRRLSPEAPVPILQQERRTLRLGGAANVAHNLVKLGCPVELVGLVGDDDAARQLRGLLAEAGIAAQGIVSESGRVTPHKIRMRAGGQQLLRIDREQEAPLAPTTEAALVAALSTALAAGADGVVISDYAKGSVTPGVLQRLRGNAISTAVDPKGRDFARYRGAQILCPNHHELAAASGRSLAAHDDAAIAEVARDLIAAGTVDAMLVTCGEAGMLLCRADQPPLRIRAERRDVYDITGAGDTVIATLAMGLFAGLGLADAAQLANTAAGIAVTRPGTATVSAAELACARSGVSHPKILSRTALAKELDHARSSGRRIVCTNGCFDLLHAGHAAFLQRARTLGDVLVVGINGDDSVGKLKGDGRPLVPASQRAALLAALEVVTWVHIFAEETPAAFIEAARPDVLVKGNEYRDQEIIGRDAVEASGGRVELIEMVAELSTTALIQRIAQRYGKAVTSAGE